jgi:hypothetical protein
MLNQSHFILELEKKLGFSIFLLPIRKLRVAVIAMKKL